MMLDRRAFISVVACSGLSSALSRVSAAPGVPAVGRKKLLILGGTGFVGPATVEAARARGHEVTLFNRGRTRPGLFPDVEKLHGDRDPKKDEGLKALNGRSWDVVIDNSGYYPRLVRASAELLAAQVRQYIFISSISAYASFDAESVDESAPLATLSDPNIETMGKDFENYGGLKALCEQAVQTVLPGRTTIVRPGYIVGPDDPTGRFTYWPVRFSRGGEVAVPGTARDLFQIIDVRDLAAWLVTLAEQGTVGTFNACGAAKPYTFGQVITACQKAAGVNSKAVWLPTRFLRKQGDPEALFPIWAPHEGKTRGAHNCSNVRAKKMGLQFRPLEHTVRDTLAWYKLQQTIQEGRVKLAGPSPEEEARLLISWKAESTSFNPY